MGIRMNPPEFPEQRRQDPKRRAEARVFDALLRLDLEGYGLYEYRFRKDGRQVDNPLWVPELGRFAVQVKGGTYEADHSDQWFLLMLDGDRKRATSPLEEASDGCIELRNGIRKATTFETYVAGVVIFTDMERNEEIEHMARERYHVVRHLGAERACSRTWSASPRRWDFHRPPSSWVSEKEWRRVYELQYGEASGRRNADRQAPEVEQRPETGGETERQVTLGSATFNIAAPGQADRFVLPAGAGRGRAAPAAGVLAGLRRMGESSRTR